MSCSLEEKSRDFVMGRRSGLVEQRSKWHLRADMVARLAARARESARDAAQARALYNFQCQIMNAAQKGDSSVECRGLPIAFVRHLRRLGYGVAQKSDTCASESGVCHIIDWSRLCKQVES